MYGTLSKAEATYTTVRYQTDVQLYSTTTLPDTSLKAMLQYLNDNFTDWFKLYDYTITISTSTQTRIRLIRKNDSRVRYWFGSNSTETSPDINSWNLVISLNGEFLHHIYTFNTSNGAFVSKSDLSTNVNTVATGLVYYTSFGAQTLDYYYGGWEGNQVTMTNFEIRRIPSQILADIGVQSSDTSIIVDNANENTDRLVNTIGGVFAGLGQIVVDSINWVADVLLAPLTPLKEFVLGFWTGLLNHTATALKPITDFIATFINDFTAMLTSLFLPTEQQTTTYFNNMTTLWSEKLGILSQAVTVLISVFQKLLTGQPQTSMTFGLLFDSPMTIQVSGIENNIPQLWTFATTIIRGGTVFLLMKGLFDKIMGVLNR
jgi:hypothetical protein